MPIPLTPPMRAPSWRASTLNTKRRSLLDAGIGRGMDRGAGTNYILNELTRLVLLRFSENGKKKYV